MRYLCLIYDEEKKLGSMSKTEMDAFTGEYWQFTDAIKKSGHHLAGEALQPVQTATTVRVRNGKMSTTDGPFAETKEQLLGLYIVDCPTLEAAIAAARDLRRANPTAVYEIRPISLFRPGTPLEVRAES